MRDIVISVLIVIIVGGIGFFQIQNNLSSQSESSLTPSTGVVIPVKSKQMQTAEDYFNAYSTCMKTPSVNCQTQNKFAGKNLGENLEQQNSPVTCNTISPKSVKATKVTEVNDDQALIILSEDFGSRTIDVMYQLQWEGGGWKVVNIVCPQEAI